MSSLVCVVDDDASVLTSLQRLLEASGYSVHTYRSGQEFWDTGDKAATACLILDVMMPGLSGLDLQQRILAERFEIPIIFVTAHDSPPVRQAALNAGARAFLPKPFEEQELLNAIDAALTSAT